MSCSAVCRILSCTVVVVGVFMERKVERSFYPVKR
jgi:hypothetical protein